MTTNEKVTLHRKTAIIVGVLFIIATAFLFIGEAFYKPILSSPDYLEITYPHRTTVIIGVLLEFIIVLAMPLIPVFAFPVLKKHNEALAIGYIVFRALESVVVCERLQSSGNRCGVCQHPGFVNPRRAVAKRKTHDSNA